MKFLGEKLDLNIFEIPLESPFYLILFERYKIFKLEFLCSMESKNSFACDLITINLMIESGLLTKTKVVYNFLRFPTM
jgi:hypothetical protein